MAKQKKSNSNIDYEALRKILEEECGQPVPLELAVIMDDSWLELYDVMMGDLAPNKNTKTSKRRKKTGKVESNKINRGEID